MEIPVQCAGNRRKRSTMAFTLIEMMVALVIVGILASLAMVQFNTYREQAKLRSSAQKVFQIFSWAKLQSEKTGNTLLIQFALPNVTVYQDRNGNGIIDAPDGTPILSESVENTVSLYSATASPPEISSFTTASGYSTGTTSCATSGVCCDQIGSPTNPSWNSVVAVCARPLPAMPSIVEDGGIYLGSTKSSVSEKWAIVMNRNISSNPSLWTSSSASPLVGDWSRVR